MRRALRKRRRSRAATCGAGCDRAAVRIDHVLAVGAVSDLDHEATRCVPGSEGRGRREVVRTLALDRRRAGKAGLPQDLTDVDPVVIGRLDAKDVRACWPRVGNAAKYAHEVAPEACELALLPREAGGDTPPSAELGTAAQQRLGRAGLFERAAPRPERSALRDQAVQARRTSTARALRHVRESLGTWQSRVATCANPDHVSGPLGVVESRVHGLCRTAGRPVHWSGQRCAS